MYNCNFGSLEEKPFNLMRNKERKPIRLINKKPLNPNGKQKKKSEKLF